MTAWLDRAAENAHKFAQRHPRALAAGVLCSLAGFAATAFGVASPTAPGTEIAQQVISEAVQPLPVHEQLEALAAHRLELNRSTVGRANDTADNLLSRLGVSDASAVAFLRRERSVRELLDRRLPRMFSARADESGRLIELVARYPAPNKEQLDTHFTRVVMQPDGRGGWKVERQLARLESQVRLGSGTISNSLFAATDDAGLPDSVATQLSEMFADEVDFHRELHKGDTFSVVYETLTADGEPIVWNEGAGHLLAAEFINGGRVHQGMWVRDSLGRGAYAGLDGQPKQRGFLASPMEFSRVTSGFAMRMHPILQTLRAHKGVDYGAPVGTAVRTVGDGVVDFAGWQNGYGNVVEIRHDGERSTLYAHLSRVDVRKGERVEQGERIGAVGATGWATGPHLHFEFRINGVHQDPLQIAKATQATLPPVSRTELQQLATSARTQLAAARSVGSISNE
ncbi:M23 family metallopeptidase [Azohydromonas caseinilytica]|uniref:M23 family metallopeptidase n=1 Tax=Azohydromonas caseinilytica TaxID=2728836 RepID=A0A848F262_9BURK|nr:M23 family metallopeptidase [Azohydromonas caseinilytica]NML13492.1 M23 family metallopeptidase [Azohydromonas caseinilytica]